LNCNHIFPPGLTKIRQFKPATEMIADDFTEGNAGHQELRWLCDLPFKPSAKNNVVGFRPPEPRERLPLAQAAGGAAVPAAKLPWARISPPFQPE
jgi:hypothetical protein